MYKIVYRTVVMLLYPTTLNLMYSGYLLARIPNPWQMESKTSIVTLLIPWTGQHEIMESPSEILMTGLRKRLLSSHSFDTSSARV